MSIASKGIALAWYLVQQVSSLSVKLKVSRQEEHIIH